MCKLPSCPNAIRMNALAFNVKCGVFALQGASAGAGLGLLSRGCQAGLWQAPRDPAAVAATLMAFCSQNHVPGVTGWCWACKRKGRLARTLAQAIGRQLAQTRGGRNTFSSLAAGPIRLFSGNTSTELCLCHQSQTTTCCDPKWCRGLSQIRPGHP